MDGKNVNELTEVTTLTDESTMLVGEENTLKRISFANVRILFWTIINTVSNLATSAKNGLMAAVDKAKLDAMSDTLKNKTVSDSVVNSPDIIVSGKAVNGALANYIKNNVGATNNDSQTKTYTLENGYRYLIIISHPNYSQGFLGIATVFDAQSKLLTISTGTGLTVSIEKLVLTVTATISAKVGLIKLDKWNG